VAERLTAVGLVVERLVVAGTMVMDGDDRRPRWRERSSCYEPEKDDFFLTLDINLSSLRS
jgi:hypothetical protein